MSEEKTVKWVVFILPGLPCGLQRNFGKCWLCHCGFEDFKTSISLVSERKWWMLFSTLQCLKKSFFKKINKASVLSGIFLHFFMLNFGKFHLKLSGNIFCPFCLLPWVLTKKHCLFFFLNWCNIYLHKIHHFILKCTVQWILPFYPEFRFSLKVAINWSLQRY